MTAASLRADFLMTLEDSQLVSSPILESVRKQLAQLNVNLADSEKVARILIRSKVITPWHARQLLLGRNEGYYLGKYKLLEILGEGGMGKVFLAEQLSMHRLVALKVIRPSMIAERSDTLARFRREAEAVAALSHPNIIQAYDFEEEEGIPYIVMEFIEGLNVRTMIDKLGRIPFPQAAEIARQAAAGLEHAHQKGMVHRDVKPGNLLVDRHGQVKLLDLGLVSTLRFRHNDELTTHQDQIGSVDYMAPEQAMDSKNADYRCDIYALGAVFYHMVTGQAMWDECTSTAQKLLKHQTSKPKPPSQLNPELPPELSALIMRMLAKKPADRPQSLADLQGELGKFARIVSPPYDPAWLKITRANLEEYCRRSPSPSSIRRQSVISSIESDITTASPSMQQLMRRSEMAPVSERQTQVNRSDDTHSGIRGPMVPPAEMLSPRTDPDGMALSIPAAKQTDLRSVLLGGTALVVTLGVIAWLAYYFASGPEEINTPVKIGGERQAPVNNPTQTQTLPADAEAFEFDAAPQTTADGLTASAEWYFEGGTENFGQMGEMLPDGYLRLGGATPTPQDRVYAQYNFQQPTQEGRLMLVFGLNTEPADVEITLLSGTTPLVRLQLPAADQVIYRAKETQYFLTADYPGLNTAVAGESAAEPPGYLNRVRMEWEWTVGSPEKPGKLTGGFRHADMRDNAVDLSIKESEFLAPGIPDKVLIELKKHSSPNQQFYLFQLNLDAKQVETANPATG